MYNDIFKTQKYNRTYKSLKDHANKFLLKGNNIYDDIS